MRNLKRIISIFLVIVLAASAAACGYTDNTQSGDKKVLRVQMESTVDTLDSQIAIYANSYELIANINEGLMRMGKDGKIEKGVAESYEVSKDGLTYTFKLRDCKWSNGTKVTAKDFVFGFLRVLNAETAAEYEYLAGNYIKNGDKYFQGKCSEAEVGVKAINDTTLEIQLEKPCAYFLNMLYLPVYYPLNEEFFKNCGELYATAPDKILSNGPFKIKTYSVKATSIELEKNTDYWNNEAVKLDGITYRVIEDSQQAMVAYENNELDIVTLGGEQGDLYKDSKELNKVMSGIMWFIRPNIKGSKELQNVNLRKALNMCIDKKKIIDNILKNSSVEADYYVPAKFAFDADGKDFQDGSETEGVNKEAAVKCWEQAKKDLNTDTVTLSLTYSTIDITTKIATYMKEEIEGTLKGFKLELRGMPIEGCVDALGKGDFDLGLTCWLSDYNDPSAFLSLMTSGNSCNFGGWKNDEYDILIQKAESQEYALKPDARWQMLKDAEKILLDEAAVFPLYQEGNDVLIKPDVHGVQFNLAVIERIYIDCTMD